MPNISKPCHNCRRRRLRCDRSWPSCHKCAVTGQECLGYGKVFVWTQATDTQHHQPSIPKPSSSGHKAPSGQTRGVAGRQHNHDAHQHQLQHQSGSPPRQDYQQLPASDRDNAQDTRQQQLPHHHVGLNSDSLAAAFGRVASPLSLQRPPLQQHRVDLNLSQLTDPVFQDLDRNSRYYLAHFANRVCQDLVARDAPGSNPFRELIPLTRKHPLLLQILIATSAIHWSNIFRPITAIPTGLRDPGGYLALLRSKDLVSRQALIDALTAKQRAIGHLREVLDTLDPAGSEVALAAMHFFIKFDLIDLEKTNSKGWQTHLEGASSILASLTPETLGNTSNQALRDCVIADCFIYHILGSTLASGALAARIARYAFELLPVMKRVELNSYLSCPAEILHIILVASQLSYETPWTDWTLSAADKALELIDEALAFDIPKWASQLQQTCQVSDVESRIHVASAHRSAACLYILQALPLTRTVRPVDTHMLVDDILGHLAQIGDEDPYFKATSWPTFIAGAETRDDEKRTWTMKRLMAIWEICPWGYVFTAIEMLKATWQMQDTSDSTESAAIVARGANWLQALKGMGFDYLIV